MIIRNKIKFIELTFERYQFGYRIDNDEFDNNWLVVHLKVDNGNDFWEKSDAALFQWEAEGLNSFLKNKKPGKINFIEPNLSFSLNIGNDRKFILSVILAQEYLPSSVPISDQYKIEFELTDNEIDEIVRCYKEELSNYPKR